MVSVISRLSDVTEMMAQSSSQVRDYCSLLFGAKILGVSSFNAFFNFFRPINGFLPKIQFYAVKPFMSKQLDTFYCLIFVATTIDTKQKMYS